MPHPTTIEQRLDALLLRCREDAHRPTYADLLAVRYPSAPAPLPVPLVDCDAVWAH